MVGDGGAPRQGRDTAAAEGHQITAGNNYMRAGNYYYSAERFIPPGHEKIAMYRNALRCYHAALNGSIPMSSGSTCPMRARRSPPIS